MKKQIIITAIIIAIVCIIGTSYAAYKLTAEQVSFDKTNTELNSDDVQGAIDELGINLSSSKQLLAEAITNKGVETSNNDSFETMASNINNIQTDCLPSSVVQTYYTSTGSGISKSFTISEIGVYLVSIDRTYGTEANMNRLNTGNAAISVSNATQKNISTGTHSAAIITKTSAENSTINVVGYGAETNKTTYLGVSIWKIL